MDIFQVHAVVQQHELHTTKRAKEKITGLRFSDAGWGVAAILVGLSLLTSGCTPTIKVATDEPITINLNVNIKHEILVKVDKQLDTLFSKESDLF